METFSPTESYKREYLDMIKRLATQRDSFDRQIAESVAFARKIDCTWGDLARALGVSAQAVQQRYTPGK